MCILVAMPRKARIVVPGVPHHITQRGTRRLPTFIQPADYALYIDLVSEGCRMADVEVLAYCLMPNHVHFVLVPGTIDGLTRALARAHQRYSWALNRRHGWQGYLWQRRFYSCPMDEAHAIAAVRYVELNPQRARLVAAPGDWPWSSARGRISGLGDTLVGATRPPLLEGIGDWRAFLAETSADEQTDALRAGLLSGRPLGGEPFLHRIEQETGRQIHARPRGRPKKNVEPKMVCVPN